MAAPKPRTPATEWETKAINALKRCTFPVGSWDKRFVRSLNIEAGLTDNERPQLWRLFLRYRRQLRDGYSHSPEMWRWAEKHAAPDLRKQRKVEAEKAKYMEAMKEKLEMNEVNVIKDRLSVFPMAADFQKAMQAIGPSFKMQPVRAQVSQIQQLQKRTEDDPNSGIELQQRVENALRAAEIYCTPDAVFVMREYIRAGMENDVSMRRLWEVRLNSIKIEQEKRKLRTFRPAQRPINEPQVFVDETASVPDNYWGQWVPTGQKSRPIPKAPTPKPKPEPTEPSPNERPFDFSND